MRFFLIDKILEFEPGVRATAVKNVALSEDFFQDHFPKKPVMPGVLILEGMAQLAGTLLGASVEQASGRKVIAIMSIVEKAKFKTFALPGDTLAYEATVESFNDVGGKTAVVARIGGKTVAECRLTFFFHPMDDPAQERKRGEVVSMWRTGGDPLER